jgi:hypothetical protein
MLPPVVTTTALHNTQYELLVALANKACNDPSELVAATVGCLGANTPHMRSAGVLALSRLQYEFAHFRSEAWQVSQRATAAHS